MAEQGGAAAAAALPPDRPRFGPAEFEPAARRAAAAVAADGGRGPLRLVKRTSNLFRRRSPATVGLDLSDFAGVYHIDPGARRAVVGGLTTYEDLVARTLPQGLIPLCVPQLRTITVGGAVTGLGIESASFRNGCPHESVVALDILTGTGQVVRAEPQGEHRDLFFGFPNSYGTLGYALRLEIELEPAASRVELTHVPCADAAEAAAVLAAAAGGGATGHRYDFVDATVFSPLECYVTLGRYTDEPGPVSDYTGRGIYYRSIRSRRRDLLTVHDYLWRWDTDWFWCSRALGAQNRVLRTLWPKSRLRSDVYWRMVALDRRWDVSGRVDSLRGRPPREAVVQDVEVPLAVVAEFLEFFHRDVGISPVWLCPLRQRNPDARWPLSSFDPAESYVNVGFWSSVPRRDGGDPADGRINRAIEAEVARLGGRKSLYSTSFYSREEFARLYGGQRYAELKRRYDPDGRFPTMYDKCVTGL